MLFGDEASTWAERIILAATGLLIGLIPKLWDVVRGFRDQTPGLLAAKQKLAAKDQTMRQQAEDRIYDRYQSWLDDLQKKVDKLEKDHLECQTEAATLRERCDNQLKRVDQMSAEIIALKSRVKELEESGGVA